MGRHVHHGPAPGPEIAERRRRAVLAGHGDTPEGLATARDLLADPEGIVRAASLGALERLGALADPELAYALDDPDPAVRRRGLEVLGGRGASNMSPAGSLVDVLAGLLVGLLADPQPAVVEVACWAAGEHPDRADLLAGHVASVATNHDDPLCREAAVAALGALGNEAGRAAVLAALNERATIRRRAVLALAAFEGPDVEAALAAALNDRDWQVRQAAEDLLRVG